MRVNVDRFDPPTANTNLATPAACTRSSAGAAGFVTGRREDAPMTTRELHAATVQARSGSRTSSI
jgi:hypothetical protein